MAAAAGNSEIDLDQKSVIVSCNDFGFCHAANSGVYSSLRNGWATCASLMVPAPWAREAAASYRGEDVGVHLTLTAEYELFRWGPVTQSPSLLGGEGGFARNVSDFWEHADLDEVRRECRSQIERAIFWGFDISHIDSHQGALVFRPEFFDIMLDLAIEFDLPLRLPDTKTEAAAGFPFRRLAAENGVLSPGHVVSLHSDVNDAVLHGLVSDLPEGISEFVFTPANDTPELRALTNDWKTFVKHQQLLSQRGSFADALSAAGIEMIGYRSLREAQRAKR